MNQNRTASSLFALTLGAIGIVYGDIGTSPLYALKEVFRHGHVPLTESNIYGVLSLVFWTLTVVVSIKYVVLILRADNNGEGGLIAMLALASQAVRDRPKLRRRLLFLGIFGTAIFFGDGVITPAISVLSAVEGLQVAAPGLHTWVVPVTLVVLTALFVFQRHGTARVGRLFGPVMAVWFLVLAALGLAHIGDNVAILKALSPHYALLFMFRHSAIAFIALGSVVLCVTGAEALYADMGHFGKRPIRMAWFGMAMPALVLNYFGQGAMLLAHPEKVGNPFFEMAPAWALLPADRAGHLRHGDRFAGPDHGGVLGDQAGDPARLPAAPARPAHLGARDRPDLRALRQLGPVLLHRHRRGPVRHQRRAGRGLRHHRHDRHADHDDDDLLRRPLRLEVPVVAGDRGDGLLLHRRLHLLRRQRRQGGRRRLVPAAHRRLHVHADDDLEAGPQAHVGEPARRMRST